MNKAEHAVAIIEEEALEVALAISLSLAQRASKALRFSLSEIQPGQPHTNGERIVHEFADLLGAMRLLEKQGLIKLDKQSLDELAEAKIKKIESFFEVSRSNGALT